MWQKTILATAIVGAGLVSSTGAAFAGDAVGGEHTGVDKGHGDHGDHGDHDDHGKGHHKGGHKKHDGEGCSNNVDANNGGHEKSGLIDVSDVQAIVPINLLCGNHVALGILGDAS